MHDQNRRSAKLHMKIVVIARQIIDIIVICDQRNIYAIFVKPVPQGRHAGIKHCHPARLRVLQDGLEPAVPKTLRLWAKARR